MTDIGELRNQASDARKAKRCDEALQLYRKLWKEHRSACTQWDGWGYAYSLRKQGLAKDALEVCREVFREDRDFVPIRNVYAWCIYDLHLKADDVEDTQSFMKAANAILELCDADDHYSPYVRTVFRVLDHMKISGSPEKMIAWTEKLDVDRLSTEAREFTDSRGKRVEVASDREKWFGLRTKALEKAERLDECRALCEQALKEISPLHYNNEIWFRRRIALAKAAAGDIAEAVSELKDLLRRRKEWFLCADISRLSDEHENPNEVIDYAIDALLLPGDLEKKWEVLLLLAEAYERANDLDAARDHACLAAALRAEQGWKSTNRLDETLDRLKVDATPTETVKAIRAKLSAAWSAHKESTRPRKLGRVKNILPNGHAGFIRADDGNEYYFQLRAFRGKRQEVGQQLRVSFVLEESFDRKKNRPSLQAAEIQIAPETT